jgi:hypothetical protein
MITRHAVIHAQLFVAISAYILNIRSKTSLCSDVKFYLIKLSIFVHVDDCIQVGGSCI